LTCSAKILENPFSYTYVHSGNLSVILQEVK